MLRDRDNNDDEAPGADLRGLPELNCRAGPIFKLFNKFKTLTSVHTGFGEFDRDPQVDLGQHGIELFVAGAVLEIGRHGFQP
jgi:hypothetical protein